MASIAPQLSLHTGIIRAELAKIFLPTTYLSLAFLMIGCSVPTEVVTDEPTTTFVPHTPSIPQPSVTIILPTITAAPTLGPTATPFVHVVEEDDTLLGIAIRYGVSLDDLLAANPGINPTILSLGQKIIIPGPEGDLGSTFLPQATPVPLNLSQVNCFPTPTNYLQCISTLKNIEEYALEGVSVLLSLLDESGDVIDSEVAFTPLNRIPQGGVVPFSAYFPTPDKGYTFAVASPISGYPATAVEDRYLTMKLDLRIDEPAADFKSWRLGGSLSIQDESERVTDHAIILAMALDSEGFVIGFRKVELNLDVDAGEGISFDFEVFSLGPRIASVEVLTEAMIPFKVE